MNRICSVSATSSPYLTPGELQVVSASTVANWPATFQGYANPYFIEVSGYDVSELLGAPQNILRHPDMPAEAFADMWATIRGGQSWSGMVKNRRKNGDHYWVRANVTPVMQEGSVVGYMSVRTKPGREEVGEAALLYQRIKEGNPDRVAIRHGAAVRTGLRARLLSLTRLSLGQRIAWNAGSLLAILAAVLAGSVSIAQSGAPAAASYWLAFLCALGIANTLYFWHTLRQGVLLPLPQAMQPAPGSRDAASQWLPPKCATLPSAVPRLPGKSGN